MIADLIVLVVLTAWTSFFWYQYIDREATLDFLEIQEDGSKDSLGKAWHAKSAAIMCFWAAVHALLFAYFSWWLAVSVFVLLLAVFWQMFDRKLNVLRGLPTDYVGKTAALDKFFRKHFADPERAMRYAKVALIGGSGLAVVSSLVVHFLSS